MAFTKSLHHWRALSALAIFSTQLAGAETREARTFHSGDFGAVGDGATLNTEALQKAIDVCHQQGGGTVMLEAGRYVTGTLQLKDHVILNIGEQATLLGSLKADDYRKVDAFKDGTGAELGYALIIAVDAQNAGLVGNGTIDGRGKELAIAQGKYIKRPFLVRWVRCSNVSVRDVTLRSSGAWTMHLFQSKEVTIEHITIRSRGLANNDGIDVDSCEDVRIQDCDIDTGDDSICLKTTSALPCRRVRVSGCRLKSNCAAIKLGTESLGDFEDIKIERCDVRGAGLGGIKLLSVDGAHLSDVRISDIQMQDVRVPIFMRLGARLRTFRAGDVPKTAGSIDNISIRNVHAQNSSQIGVFITGIPEHPVKNIHLEEIQIALPGGGTIEQNHIVLEEKEQAYPEVKMFGETMPAYGVYLRHASGIKIKGLKLSISQADARPATLKVDANDVEMIE